MDLGSAYSSAQDTMRGFRLSGSSSTAYVEPSSSSGSSSQSAREPRAPTQREIERAWKRHQRELEIQRQREEWEEHQERERQQRLEEDQRVRDNIVNIKAGIAAASGQPLTSRRRLEPSPTNVARRGAAVRAILQSRVRFHAPVENARAIRTALEARRRPPFAAVLGQHHYNRPVAFGLTPTLGLVPREGEASLADLGGKARIEQIKAGIPAVVASVEFPFSAPPDITKRYYVGARDLAGRLVEELGDPIRLEGDDIRQGLAGKRGIVYLDNAYWRKKDLVGLSPSGDHIDVWDRDHVQSSSSTPFETADFVLLWELP